jgi:hypothetical protein
MPHTFDYDSTNRVLRCRFAGRVTAQEFANYLRTVGQYVALTSPRGGVTDLSAVSSFDVSIDAIHRLAGVKPSVPQIDHPRVILTSSNRIFWTARMFEIEAESVRPNLHVVRTWNEAGAILGVRKFHFEPIQLQGEPC